MSYLYFEPTAAIQRSGVCKQKPLCLSYVISHGCLLRLVAIERNAFLLYFAPTQKNNFQTQKNYKNYTKCLFDILALL